MCPLGFEISWTRGNFGVTIVGEMSTLTRNSGLQLKLTVEYSNIQTVFVQGHGWWKVEVEHPFKTHVCPPGTGVCYGGFST